MAWVPVLLLLSSYFMGTFSQFVMTQPASVSASLGGTVQITCTKSSGTIGTGYSSWYQQKPGGAPNLIIYQDNKRPSGIPARFSGSLENSAKSATLTISSLQGEDEADYYCSCYAGSGIYLFGPGTQLTVLGQPTVSPTVRAFGPGQEGTEKKILACLLSNFYPPTFNLQWKVGGNPIESGVETSKATKQGDKYLASSYLSLPRSAYGKGNLYTCEVTHEGKTISKSVSDSGSC